MQFMHQIFTEEKSCIDLLTISEEFLFQFFEEIACLEIRNEFQVVEGSGFSNGSKYCYLFHDCKT